MREDFKRKEIVAIGYGDKWKMGPVPVFCVFLTNKPEFRTYLQAEMLIADLCYRFATKYH